MKIRDGFILKEIAGNFVVVPVGEDLVDFTSMITTNETGAFLWKKLQNGATTEELCQSILNEYEGVSYDEAMSDVKEFVNVLKEKNIVE